MWEVPAAESSWAELRCSRFSPGCHSKQRQSWQVGILTYPPCPSPSHMIHMGYHSGNGDGKGEAKETFTNCLWMDCLWFQPGTFPWTQREAQDSLQRDSSTSCPWIHLHFSSCLVWEGSTSPPCVMWAHPGFPNVIWPQGWKWGAPNHDAPGEESYKDFSAVCRHSSPTHWS